MAPYRADRHPYLERAGLDNPMWGHELIRSRHWDEQDRLFEKLPGRLAQMVLFAANTDLRQRNGCEREWIPEVAVPEMGRSVFVHPPEPFKSRRASYRTELSNRKSPACPPDVAMFERRRAR